MPSPKLTNVPKLQTGQNWKNSTALRFSNESGHTVEVCPWDEKVGKIVTQGLTLGMKGLMKNSNNN